jgi:hypothetical protein
LVRKAAVLSDMESARNAVYWEKRFHRLAYCFHVRFVHRPLRSTLVRSATLALRDFGNGMCDVRGAVYSGAST